jgi:hypothetical protein
MKDKYALTDNQIRSVECAILNIKTVYEPVKYSVIRKIFLMIPTKDLERVTIDCDNNILDIYKFFINSKEYSEKYHSNLFYAGSALNVKKRKENQKYTKQEIDKFLDMYFWVGGHDSKYWDNDTFRDKFEQIQKEPDGRA